MREDIIQEETKVQRENKHWCRKERKEKEMENDAGMSIAATGLEL